MFNEGTLLYFDPFIFKNGATPKRKYFIVLRNTDNRILLASLPTSKDHIPSDIDIQSGCIEITERCINVFVFIAGYTITTNGFKFPKNTFVYGANIDEYSIASFTRQQESKETTITEIGMLNQDLFNRLKKCLAESKMVKNRYRRLL